MSTQRFFLHSDAEGKVFLHIEAEGATLEFEDTMLAIATARALSEDGKALLITYDAAGGLAFRQEV